MTNRRDFLKAAAAAAAVASLGSRAQAGTLRPRPTDSDPFIDDLALEALNAAKAAGASYADARIGRYRRQFVGTRERQVTGVQDSESYGIGVRALVAGSWGFAATSDHDPRRSAAGRAQEAVRLAKAARTVQKRPVELAPVAAVKGTWRTPITRDPIDVPIEEKVALLLAANEAALKVPKVRFVNSGLAAAARGEDARHHRRHARHADVRARRLRSSRRLRSATATSRATTKSSRRADSGGSTSSRSTCRATPSAGRRSPPRS